jgi:hypothetical protein
MPAKTTRKKSAPATLPAVRLDVHPNVIIATEISTETVLLSHTVATSPMPAMLLAHHHAAAFASAGCKVMIRRYDAAGNLLP